MEGQHGRVRYGECNSRASRLQDNLTAQTWAFFDVDSTRSYRTASAILIDHDFQSLTPGTVVRALPSFVRGMRLTNVW